MIVLACSTDKAHAKTFHAFGRLNDAGKVPEKEQAGEQGPGSKGIARREPAPRIEAVLCRFKESVQWLAQLPKTGFHFVIHNKGGHEHALDATGLDKDITTIIDLPNIGTEGINNLLVAKKTATNRVDRNGQVIVISGTSLIITTPWPTSQRSARRELARTAALGKHFEALTHA
jgi:hypothetical protein